ncbi:MAG: hypothetical protein K0R51_2492 [Cytophagaceae bacterium]|jgi:hypothetical protein|nr:hypothetical protein [Cytophagaceae bacterium]
MKRSFLLNALFLFVFTCSKCFSQDVMSKDFEVITSTPYEVVNASYKEYFSDGKNQVIALKVQGRRVIIQRFDFVTMKEISKKVYEDFPETAKMQVAFKVADKIFYIYECFNDREKKHEVYAREVIAAEGIFDTPKLLLTTSMETMPTSYLPGGGMGGYIPIRFELVLSYDKSKVLVKYRTKPTKRRDAVSFDMLGFYVFDSSFEKIWGGEVQMPYTEKEMNNLAYAVDKKGGVYMLAQIVASKSIELLNIHQDLTVTSHKIDIGRALTFWEFKILEDEAGNLVALGYYANGVDFVVSWAGKATLSLNVNGILQVKMSSDGKIIEKTDIEFPLELINQYESQRTQDKNNSREEKGKAGINDLRIVEAVLHPDGSTTVIGEQQFIRMELVVTSQIPVQYYGDVIATKFTKKGEVLWQEKMPKMQAGLAKGGSSIKFIKSSANNYILYLDNIKNANLSEMQAPEKHKDGTAGYLMVNKINDETGKIEKHPLFSLSDINGVESFQFKTSRILDAAENTFLLELYIKEKKDMMVKLKLKD